MTRVNPIDLRPTALYRFFAEDGELLYVGITINPKSRIRGHAKDKQWFRFGEVADIEVEWFDNRRLAMDAEDVAIWQEQPRYNIERPLPKKAPDVERHGDLIGLDKALEGLGIR